jgi:hypothetical protein
VKLLRKKGFRAHRMEQGVVDWRARGWRVTSPQGDSDNRAKGAPR